MLLPYNERKCHTTECIGYILSEHYEVKVNMVFNASKKTDGAFVPKGVQKYQQPAFSLLTGRSWNRHAPSYQAVG